MARKRARGRPPDDERQFAPAELRLRRRIRIIRHTLAELDAQLADQDEELGNLFSEWGYLKATEGETDDA